LFGRRRLTCVDGGLTDDPSVGARVVRLHEVGGRAAAPSAHHEQQLVRHPRLGQGVRGIQLQDNYVKLETNA